MNICFLSYEFPPGTGNGIGSYTFQAALALAQAGHKITVIAGAGKDLADKPVQGIRVVRLPWEGEGRFFYEMKPTHRNLRQVAEACRRFHQERPFDLIEAPDYRAEAYYLLREGIDCPVVTKLHTPSYPIWDMEAKALHKPWLRRLLARWLVLASRDRLERLVIQRAARVHAPSRAVGALVEQYYGINPDHVDVVPYPYSPSFPGNPIPDRTSSVVLYVGRLEVRKGVHLFASIIPQVVRRFPQARFWFLGEDGHYRNNLTMSAWLRAQLGAAAEKCVFLGPAPYSEVPDYMRQAAVCVFPSLWDNFPNVCLEAMDVGACVVGSVRGGMAEMIEDGESGFLADPSEPQAFADKIVLALSDQELRQRCGAAARQRVFDLYRPEVIIPRQIAAYQRAIEHFRRGGLSQPGL